MKWTVKRLAERQWIKITLVRRVSPQTPLAVDIRKIEEYLEENGKEYLFHPQDYRYVVKFAVEDWDTAMMIKLMAHNETIVEEAVLRPEQIERIKD